MGLRDALTAWFLRAMRMRVAVLVMCVAGCATPREGLFPMASLRVEPRAPTGCLEQLIVRSRHAGYLEKQVDRSTNTFVAASHVPDSWVLKRGSIYSVKRGHLSGSTEHITSLPGDVPGRLAVVRFFSVQCTGASAVITPLGEGGAPLPADTILNASQAWELQRYAAHLGVVTSTLQPIAR